VSGTPIVEMIPNMILHADRTAVAAVLTYSNALAGTPVPGITDGVVIRAGADGVKVKNTLVRGSWIGARLHACAHLYASTGGTEAMSLRVYGRKDVIVATVRTSMWFMLQEMNSGAAINATTQPGCVGANDVGGNDILYIEPIQAGGAFDAYTIVPHTAIGGTAARINTYIGVEIP